MLRVQQNPQPQTARRGFFLSSVSRIPAVDRLLTEREKQKAIIKILDQGDVMSAVHTMQEDPENVLRVAKAIAQSSGTIGMRISGCKALVDFKNAGGDVMYCEVRKFLDPLLVSRTEPEDVCVYALLATTAISTNERIDYCDIDTLAKAHSLILNYVLAPYVWDQRFPEFTRSTLEWLCHQVETRWGLRTQNAVS